MQKNQTQQAYIALNKIRIRSLADDVPVQTRVTISFKLEMKNLSENWQELVDIIFNDKKINNLQLRQLYSYAISNYRIEIRNYIKDKANKLLKKIVRKLKLSDLSSILSTFALYQKESKRLNSTFSMFFDNENDFLQMLNSKFHDILNKSNKEKIDLGDILITNCGIPNLQLEKNRIKETLQLISAIELLTPNSINSFIRIMFQGISLADECSYFIDVFNLIPSYELVFLRKLVLILARSGVQNNLLQLSLAEKRYQPIIFEILTFSNELRSNFVIALKSIEFRQDYSQIIELCESLEKQQSFFLRITIENALRNKLSSYANPFVTYFSRFLDEKIRKDISIAKYTSTIKIIQEIELFQSLFLSSMIKRLLFKEIYFDREFVNEYRKKYGMLYAKKFQTVIDEYEESRKVFKEYKKCTQGISNSFSIKALPSSLWSIPVDTPNVNLPEFISNEFTKFSMFYTQKFRNRKIQFNLRLTTFTLSIQKLNVKCDGIIAILLYCLSDGPKTIEDIMKETNISQTDIEKYLKVMSSNYLINLRNQNTYQLCDTMDVKTIKVPFNFPNDRNETEKISKMWNMMTTNAQIDALISRILKENKSMNKMDLLRETQKHFVLSISEKLFNSRIGVLKKKSFIEEDESGNLIYIP